MLTNSIHYKYIESVNNLSIKNVGITGSNPSVACLIVDFRINPKGVVLSYGLTSQTGRPHAEINALNKISKSQINDQTTLYVSLEPCFKEDNCCAKKISNKGIKRVVIASKDPNPDIYGRGIDYLRSKDIKVIIAGPSLDKFKLINKYFYFFQKKNRPFITLKIAISKNNFSKNLKEKNISSIDTQHYMHKLRLKHDAIVIGYNTYADDKPMLTCRLSGIKKSTRAFILTKKIRRKLRFIQISFNEAKGLNDFFKILQEYRIQSVLIEGGLQTFKYFLKKKVFNEVFICQSSQIIKNSKKRYKLDKKLIKNSCKKLHSQIYNKDIIEIYKNV